VNTNADFSISVEHGPEVLRTADTVIIAPFSTGNPRRQTPVNLAQALAYVAPGTRIASTCTGAFVLAAAGLLDGRRATTHWHAAGIFREWYPQVELDPNVLFVDEGDVLTSAGAVAGIDLCLHLVRKDHGTEIANHVARTCVAPRGATGVRRSTSNARFPQPRRAERPRPANGRCRTCTSH
jgi:transcriptional regulator GlxA family with amidase domain